MVSIRGLCAILAVAILVRSQENTQTRVPESLLECYRTAYLLDRDQRLPMTMRSLIEMIRKVEDTPNINMDIRQIAIGLIHRFRMDGIERAPGVIITDSIVPFSPTGFQFNKHRLLLKRLIQGNANNFPNATLSAQERCTLHFMLSSSIETAVRGDENTRCSSLAQYRSDRVPREAKFRDDDVEVLQDIQRLNKGNLAIPEEVADDQDSLLGVYGAEQVSTAISQCPVENGVIATRWGAISAGTLLAGIAAGLQPESVTTKQLLQLYGVQRSGAQTAGVIDNRWAATLAGDLAETALYQAHLDNTQVGVSGAFNSSHVQRWYFLGQNTRLEMTDAEIRGGIDGLILADQIKEWTKSASSLRLSQLLDMYYSQRGVLGTQYRACDRRGQFTGVAPAAVIEAQTLSFATILDREVTLRVSLDQTGIASFARQASESLLTYVPSSLNDLTCQVTASASNPDLSERINTDIYIVLDTTWPYIDIVPGISLLLDSLNIYPYGSRYTIWNANDFSLIVNTTHYVNDFHSLVNLTTYQQNPTGFQMSRILKGLRTQTTIALETERQNSTVGGRSNVVLFIPYTQTLNEGDANFAIEQIKIFREEVPDLHFLFLAGGSPGRFAQLVRDEARDIYPLTISQNMSPIISPVVDRIKQVPRRVINYFCGSNWQRSGNAALQFTDYVEIGGANYYRLHPNYFFRGGKVRIQGQASGTISVCYSRQVENARASNSSSNALNDDVNCRQIVSSDTVEIDLGNACEGRSRISECPPLYIGIEATKSAASVYQCIDRRCVTPDSVGFNINAEGLDCYSGVFRILGSLQLVTFALFGIWRLNT